MSRQTVNILIGGEAGQGLVTVGELLARSLVRSGFFIVVTQNYMSRIRGGHNSFAIRAGITPIAAPQEPLDLLLALNEDTIRRHAEALTPAGLIVADAKLDLAGHPGLNAPFDAFGAKKFENVAALGILGALLGLEEPDLRSSLEIGLGSKKPELLADNRRALISAYTWTKTHAPAFPGLVRPGAATLKRIMLNGNEALALGALAAGVKLCAFYPMTPATTIPLTLIRHADAMGIVVEQAEDEIAAVNMAIGASFAGAPSLVATSGGGFALMTEGVSLAGMTETPLVCVVAQRPGPATGLPTRTEQADLEMVLHAGHGEFPRAILTPGSVEECFDLTRQAFRLAEHYQTPIFLLTDQFLADSYRAVVPFDPASGEDAGRDAAVEPVRPYRRFAFTESGISPRCLPGLGADLVVADSDEHTEDGHITEDLTIRRRMVDKRLKKFSGLIAEVIPPRYLGEANPELLLICWGSALGAVSEAAAQLSAQGRRTGCLHFSQVWPLIPNQFMNHLESAQQVVAIEGNATAQFARLIRRETGFAIPRQVRRYDGLPLTPEYILLEINR